MRSIPKSRKGQGPLTLESRDLLGVAEQVAAQHRIPVDLIRSRRRSKDIAEARHHLAYELRELGLSYPAIGEVMNRDHSTAMFSVRKWARICGEVL